MNLIGGLLNRFFLETDVSFPPWSMNEPLFPPVKIISA